MILVTGAAGFIGFHLAKSLLDAGENIVGVDNLNNYYDVSLKLARLKILKQYPNFSFEELDIADRVLVPKLFKKYSFKTVVNLAAQAGVRYSLINPLAYIDSNILGFTNIIEGCRHNNVEHLIYASSSSVYGANSKQPFSEGDAVDHPLAIYAATKKCNELIAHSYSSLYDLPTTGLRFFTVYGPWGRPDMALFLFTKAILAREPINLFNNGNMVRDFTYIDDIISGIRNVISRKAEINKGWDAYNPDSGSSYAPYKIYNIGNSSPVQLIDYVKALEISLGIEAKINYAAMQDGDVLSSFASVDRLEKDFNYRPKTKVTDGIAKFVKWYKDFYQVQKVPG